jgi:hypothetical protein
MSALLRWPDGKWLRTVDQTFTTGAIPNIAVPTLCAIAFPQNGTPSPGVELVNVIDPTGISAVSDVAGNIIWYYDNTADSSWKGYAFPIKPLPSPSSRAQRGNMLAAITNLYSAGVPQTIPYNSVLREIDLVGNPVRELYLADLNTALTKMGSDVQALCYSHDVLPLWNGHTILLVQQQKSVWLTAPPGPGQFTILGDAMIDLDESFNPVWTWSTFDWLDVNRHPMEFTGASGYDWTHCNCIQLAPDGNLVLSSRHQNWVMKIDYEGGSGNGTILWKLGYQGDFTLVGSATQPTDWFFAQHYPNLLEATGNQITLPSVFDNGNDRCYAMPGGCAATNPAPPTALQPRRDLQDRRDRDDRAARVAVPPERVLVLGRERHAAFQRGYRNLRLRARADRRADSPVRCAVPGRRACARLEYPDDRLVDEGVPRRHLPLVPRSKPVSRGDLV